jgi:hypothetical protein
MPGGGLNGALAIGGPNGAMPFSGSQNGHFRNIAEASGNPALSGPAGYGNLTTSYTDASAFNGFTGNGVPGNDGGLARGAPTAAGVSTQVPAPYPVQPAFGAPQGQQAALAQQAHFGQAPVAPPPAQPQAGQQQALPPQATPFPAAQPEMLQSPQPQSVPQAAQAPAVQPQAAPSQAMQQPQAVQQVTLPQPGQATVAPMARQPAITVLPVAPPPDPQAQVQSLLTPAAPAQPAAAQPAPLAALPAQPADAGPAVAASLAAPTAAASQATAPQAAVPDGSAGSALTSPAVAGPPSQTPAVSSLIESVLSSAGSPVRGRRAARRPRLAMSAVFADLVDMARIPRTAYAVDDEVTGAMCLFKTDGGYEVFSCAEDARHEVRFFEEEEAAYFYLFGVLAAEALRNGRLKPAR